MQSRISVQKNEFIASPLLI